MNGDSFKNRLISRLVASVKYYLTIRDMERVEKGLMTLLRVIGYISSEFVHVSSSIAVMYIVVLALCCF